MFCAGCAANNTSSIFKNNLKEFDWVNQSPLKFLDVLRKEDTTCYPIFGVKKNWVKKENIPKLMSLIDSKEPCAAVSRTISSYFDFKGSTIGDEAAFIIMGFQKGEYPPDLNSTRPKITGENKTEILSWWEEFKTKNHNNAN